MPRDTNGIEQDSDHFAKSHFWRQDAPDSLMESCLSFIVNNFERVFYEPSYHSDGSNHCKLHSDTILPPYLFEDIHKKSLEMCRPLAFTHLLRCTSQPLRFPMEDLDLALYPQITDSDLNAILANQRLAHLSVNSTHLTHLSLKNICNLAPNLVSLKAGQNSKFLLQEMNAKDVCCQLSRLKRLSLNAPSPAPSEFFEVVFSDRSHRLAVLDLSDSTVLFDLPVDHINFGRLEVLSLHNVSIFDISVVLDIVSKLTTLRKLDLGQSYHETPVKYGGDVTSAMKNLVNCLQHLEWLEICGTNLAGTNLDARTLSERMKGVMKIPPFEWLSDRRLKYLGLLNCFGQPCTHEDLPAEEVSGDSNINQILTSLESYVDRPMLLLSTLNVLFDCVRSSQNFTEVQEARALEYTLRALDRHVHSRDIQLSGSASIFCMIKGNLKTRMTVRIRKHVIRAILDAMENGLNYPEPSMCRNGCLILCHFRIPLDLLYDYSRIVTLLLNIIERPEPQDGEAFIQRISLNLLNSLACQVDNKEKLLVGELRTFEVMLNIINKKLEENVCDEIMEVAWSLMWNATDETAQNCERFIMNGGLQMFMRCYEAFKDRGELLRNMMGLMGNVAEVDHLKCHLITPAFVPTFRDLLDSESDGIEVSYNSCGILANLMLRGPSSWGDLVHYWSSVQVKMRQAMARWPIASERNINYRSFGPILRLLDCTKVLEVQQWALWALCNLTKVYRSKYCSLLKEENGVDRLIELFIGTSSPLIRRMTAKVIRRCNRHELYPDAVSDSEDDDLGLNDPDDRDKDGRSISEGCSGTACEKGDNFERNNDVDCGALNGFDDCQNTNGVADDALDSFDTRKKLRHGSLRSMYRHYFFDFDETRNILEGFLRVLNK